ncbi:Pentatricopeptide repeat [Dillenia turbinata]|uniref:Pentatricopeptide repeat n=1 Tax=Dillenia turbinata TaxID=194707 RepID=A0AAN8ZB84_9MAGN
MAAAARAAGASTACQPISSLVSSITSTLQTLNPQNPSSRHSLNSIIPHLDPNLVIQVIKHQTNPRLSLFFFNWSSNPKPNPNNYCHTPLCYSAITDHLLSHKLSSAASSLLESHNQLSGFLIAKFIKFHGDLGDLRGVVHWFHRAKSIQFGGCLYSYNSVLGAVVKADRIDLARALYGQIVKENIVKPNVLTCTIMIRGYCKMGMVDDAKKVFDEMTSEPNLVTYNTMIHGFVRKGLIENALEIIERMKQSKKYLPDTVTYTTLIDGYCKRGEMDEAMKCMDEMVKNGCEPNVLTYNALINGLCLKGDVDEAKRMMTKMRLDGLKDDVCTHSSLLKGFCISGRSDEAFKHLRDMVGRGMKMDVKSYGVVLNEYCRMGKPNEAISLLKEMKTRGITPSVTYFSALVEKLVDSGDLDKAIDVLKQMHQMRCSPNFLSYSTVILGISRAKGGMQEVEELVMDLRQNGHELDASMYSCLVKGYCEDCNVQKAIQVFLESMCAGYVISIETFAILLNELCASWKVSGLDEVFDEMSRRYGAADVGSYKETYKRLWMNGQSMRGSGEILSGLELAAILMLLLSCFVERSEVMMMAE